MKRSVLLILIAGCFSSVSGQTAYNIHVKINGGPSAGKAFLKYWSSRGPYLDSVSIHDGEFSLTGNMPEKLTVAKIWVTEPGKNNTENSCDIWLEPAIIHISADKTLTNARYSGSDMQQQFSVLEESLRTVKQKERLLNKAYEKAEAEDDLARKDKLLNEEYPTLFVEKQKILGAFIQKHPASPLSAFKFEDFAGEGQIDLAVVEPVYNILHDSIKQNSKVKKVAALMDISRRTAPGMPAIEFSQTDTSGNVLSLSSFRGKTLLIDFWAGWCMPCRAENPYLRTLYSRYRKKGFEILGVSLDGERVRWTNAIHDDKLIWPQVSDLNIFENEVAKLYGVTSIPQNILIGSDQKIIAWNLRGSALEKKLEEIFK